MVSGCSGVLNDRVYSVTPNNSSYTLDSTSLNGTALTNASGCQSITSFIYSTCTAINDPPTIVMVGTDTHGTAGARLLQFSSSGQCQISEKWYLIPGMTQPVSVVRASCDSQLPIPCFAVLGISSTTHQYIIQYPTSLSFNGGLSPITVGSMEDSTIHPVLALPPNDISKLYVLGYPTKNQIFVLPNGIKNNNQTTNPSLLTSTTTTTTHVPSTIATIKTLLQPSDKNSGTLFGRAEPPNSGAAGSYIKLDASIENSGPAVTVGTNIVIVSTSSLSAQLITTSATSTSTPNTLTVTKFDLPPSSQIQNANTIKGIDSLTPLPPQNGDLSTVWINYDDGNGNHVQISSQQPGLFISPPAGTGTGTVTPGSESTDAALPSSLSGGAIAGIVIGSLCGFLLLAFLCFYLWRKQQQRQRLKGDGGIGINTRALSLTHQQFLATEKTASTPTTYIATPTKEEDGDFGVPAPAPICYSSGNDDVIDNDMLPPLTSLTRQINNNHHSGQTHDNDYYQPTRINGNLVIEPYVYHLHHESPTYAHFPQGYATRSATRTHISNNINNNNMQQPTSTECTIHYFPASAASYVRHLLYTNAELQQNNPSAAAAGLHTYDAITLAPPSGQYQYIWITSLYHPHHILDALLFHPGGSTVVDCTQFSFKAWSTLSMLKALDTFHQSGWVHRQINPTSFFYDQASSVTEWRLLGFYQSIWYTGLPDQTSTSGVVAVWDEWSAPECFVDGGGVKVSMTTMDVWSLGCVLYSVATGKRVFQHMHEYQTLLRSGQLQAKLDAMMDDVAMVDETYKELLYRMLQINSSARDSLSSLINYWIQTNQLEDDE